MLIYVIKWQKNNLLYVTLPNDWTKYSVKCNFVVFLLQEREQAMPLMMKGFRDAAEEGGTSVTGGQTVVNPWIIIGGVATVVCQPTDFIMWVF